MKLNRRDPILVEQPGVDAAASFDFRDEIAERIGIYSQRLAEASAQSSPDRR
ncbi:hypothetical protein [Shewanella psychropiezotolerans]|uniref:hypothetical protein n=1 Tax=Shewanella psychropiezotolerans TaxID=2593655 RepID=UPI00163DD898|nr:hypothetical protein [Shewanella psychropiezotolerans]